MCSMNDFVDDIKGGEQNTIHLKKIVLDFDI